MTPKKNRLKPTDYLNDEQQRTLLRYVKEQADLARARGSFRAIQNELIIRLVLGSGLRASELCGLNLEDLPVIHNQNEIYIKDGKGGKSRSVMIPQSIADLIAKYCKIAHKDLDPDKPLLLNEKAARMSYPSLYAKIKGIGARAGIKLHPHMLRHSYACNLYEIERDLYLVSDQLGHSSTDTTHIYAKTKDPHKRRQIEALSDE